jgi:hypothetical protein
LPFTCTKSEIYALLGRPCIQISVRIICLRNHTSVHVCACNARVCSSLESIKFVCRSHSHSQNADLRISFEGREKPHDSTSLNLPSGSAGVDVVALLEPPALTIRAPRNITRGQELIRIVIYYILCIEIHTLGPQRRPLGAPRIARRGKLRRYIRAELVRGGDIQLEHHSFLHLVARRDDLTERRDDAGVAPRLVLALRVAGWGGGGDPELVVDRARAAAAPSALAPSWC